METGNEMDELLKRAMQFDSGELPEVDPDVQNRLRKKVKSKKASGDKKIIAVLVEFFNIDIKLYHAGIAMVAVALIFVVLRNTGERPGHRADALMLADTNTGSSLKDDSFLVKNFSTQIY